MLKANNAYCVIKISIINSKGVSANCVLKILKLLILKGVCKFELIVKFGYLFLPNF